MQATAGGADGWEDVYGVLRGTSLLCYRRGGGEGAGEDGEDGEEDAWSGGSPLLVIPVNTVGFE